MTIRLPSCEEVTFSASASGWLPARRSMVTADRGLVPGRDLDGAVESLEGQLGLAGHGKRLFFLADVVLGAQVDRARRTRERRQPPGPGPRRETSALRSPFHRYRGYEAGPPGVSCACPGREFRRHHDVVNSSADSRFRRFLLSRCRRVRPATAGRHESRTVRRPRLISARLHPARATSSRPPVCAQRSARICGSKPPRNHVRSLQSLRRRRSRPP